MVGVNRADAKAHLDGVPVAQITSIGTPRKPINPAMLRAVTDRMSAQRQDAATFVRAMRDDERY